MILVLVAYNYRTIDHCVKFCSNAIVLNDDVYDCEEKGSEKKSDDKIEKKEFLECISYEGANAALGPPASSFSIHYIVLSHSSGHSRAVYPPPDQANI